MRSRQLIHPLLPLFVALLLVSGAAPAQADVLPKTITVNTLNNANTNDDGQCTLREAMQNAVALRSNDDCGPEVSGAILINFSVSGTINVDTQLPNLTDNTNVAIVGPITLNLAGAGIAIDLDGGTISLANLTLKKADSIALNISSGATANVAGVFFDGNSGGAGGAAITNRGTLRVAGSLFQGNKSTASYDGGAIFSSGDTIIAGSIFNGNTSARSGGAITAVAGSIEIADTIFNGNIANGDAGYGGGALYFTASANFTAIKIVRSVFNGNLAPNGGGGAIFHNAENQLNIRDSSFQGNLAGIPTQKLRPGGALLNWGTTAISNTVFLNNAASKNGGAIANGDADSGVQTPPPQRNGRLTVSNTSFTANAAGSYGGAIANMYVADGPALRLTNVTFSANVAASAGGSLYNQEPKYDLANVTNTIFDGGLPQNCDDPDSDDPPLVSGGHNLDSGTSCGLGAAGDLTNASANLAAPFFNGGPIATLLTQKLNAGSAAADAGDPAVCAAPPISNKDQRGYSRPKGAACDIGAFEAEVPAAIAQITPLPPGPLDLGTVQLNTQGPAVSVAISNPGDAPLTLGAPTLGGANPAEFAVVSGLPATITAGGSGALQLRCAPTGAAGARSATLTFNSSDLTRPSLSYTLLCDAVSAPTPGVRLVPPAPGPVSFGDVGLGDTANRTVQIQSQGTAALTISGAALGGPNAADFSVVTGPPASIAAGASATVTLRCTPGALGARSGSYTFSTNDPTQPSVSFTLVCAGFAPPSPPFDLGGSSAGAAAGSAGPYGLAFSPDGRHIYAADSGDSHVALYRLASDGTLSFGATYTDGSLGGDSLLGARNVAVSPDGENVYVAAFGDDAITSFDRNPDTGILSNPQSVIDGDSFGCLPLSGSTITGLDGAWGLTISPDGRFVYVSGINANAVVVLRRNVNTGSLKAVYSSPCTAGTRANVAQQITHPDMLGPTGMTLSPDGAQLYVAGNNSNKLVAFKRDASTGLLTYLETKSGSSAPFSGGMIRTAISPDGAYLYTANDSSNSLGIFRRNPADGKLSNTATLLNSSSYALDGADSVTISPDGQYLFATAFNSDALTVFQRNQTNGGLRAIQVLRQVFGFGPDLDGPRQVVVSPDGRTIAVTAFNTNKVWAFGLANPDPTLSSLGPASATAQPGAITLTVNGEGFVPSSVVRWNNALDLSTTFVSSTKLQASVGVGLLTTAGTRPVTVRNPAPGGGTSAALTFTITAPDQNPIPSVTNLSPAGAAAGASGLTVTVSGANFLSTSVVQWNGAARQTTYVSPSTLQVLLTSADLAQAGDAAVRVSTPAPGGGPSNAVIFSVAAPGIAPPPALNTLSPASGTAGGLTGGSQLVVLRGSGFIEGSQGRWEGQTRPTTFISASELRLAVTGADLVTDGQYSVDVVNPDGQSSAVVSFRVLAPGENPVPAVDRVSGITRNSDGTLTLTVTGGGFITGSQAQWNGAARGTSVVNGTTLTVVISAADYGGGSALLSVANPTPGGGTSAEFLVLIGRTLTPLVRR